MSNPEWSLQGFSTRQKIYNFIRAYWEEYNLSPSMREIMDGCGISSTSIVYHHILILRKEGIVDFRPKSNRTIVLVGATTNLPAPDPRYG